MLSGEGKGSTDDESDDTKLSVVNRPPPLHCRAESLDCRGALDLPELLQVPGVRNSLSVSPMAMVPAEYQDCNGKMVHVPNEFYLHMDGHKDDPLDYDDDMDDVSAPWGFMAHLWGIPCFVLRSVPCFQPRGWKLPMFLKEKLEFWKQGR